jgi:hypothetical protein
MRLSAWRDRAPHKDALNPKVVAVIDPILTALGAGTDPDCWIVWGDDPASRYMVLALGDAGLIVVNVRVNVPQEGPRASGKLVRWSRVQTGELAIELTGGHRLLSFQVEGQVLRGTDEGADDIAMFALRLFAAQDGRPQPAPVAPKRATAASTGGSSKRTRAAGVLRLPAPTEPGR